MGVKGEVTDCTYRAFDRELSNLAQWSEEVLQRIVAHFVRIRFPILLALNKCDTPSSAEHIHRCGILWPLPPPPPPTTSTFVFVGERWEEGLTSCCTV